METTVIGHVPDKPMTRHQRQVHANLARAEKSLIAALVWELPADEINKRERIANRYTRAWKRACRHV